jgi:Zn-dependent peptidase ImmA (M78 family)
MTVPDFAARRVISDLHITRVEDLLLLKEIAWERNAILIEDTLDGAEAQILIGRPRSIITISTSVTDQNRKRFGIAHEIGHLELHRRNGTFFVCTSSDINTNWLTKRQDPSLEQEANQFAASLLMPEIFFAPFCQDGDPSLARVSEIANCFSVSLTAACLRFIQFCKEPVAIVYTKDNIIQWFKANHDFEELGLFVDVKGILSRATLAYHTLKDAQGMTQQKQVALNSWLRPGPYNSQATLAEQSVSMPSMNATLSMLWINEIIDEDDY